MTEQRDDRSPLERWLKEGYEKTCGLPRRRVAQPTEPKTIITSVEMPHGDLGQGESSAEPTAEQNVALRLGRLMELEGFAAGMPGVEGPRTDAERKLLEEIRQGNVRVAREIEKIRRQDAQDANKDPLSRFRPMTW